MVTVPTTGTAQDLAPFEKRWSDVDRISIEDFRMDPERAAEGTCFGQFSMNYEVGGFPWFTKNFNQSVHNVMIPSASYLNASTLQKDGLVRYQQLLFDLSEVYARKFRMRLLEERKQLMKGPHIAKEINEEILRGFSEEHALFDKLSAGGTKIEVMAEWESKIDQELRDLHEFRFENEAKIRSNN